MDRHWDLLRANRAARGALRLAARRRRTPREPPNVMRLMFDPAGCARTWPTGRRRRDAGPARAPRGGRRRAGPVTAALLDEVLGAARRPCRAGARPTSRARRCRLLPVASPRTAVELELLLDGHDARHAAGRHAAGAPHRGVLPGRRRHRRPRLVTAPRTRGDPVSRARAGFGTVAACTSPARAASPWTPPSGPSARPRAAAAGPRCCGACCAGAPPARPWRSMSPTRCPSRPRAGPRDPAGRHRGHRGAQPGRAVRQRVPPRGAHARALGARVDRRAAAPACRRSPWSRWATPTPCATATTACPSPGRGARRRSPPWWLV